jgi:hypothetical protein
MSKKIRSFFVGVFIIGLLSACQSSTVTTQASESPNTNFRGGFSGTLSPSGRETRMAQVTSGTFQSPNGTLPADGAGFPGGFGATPQPGTSSTQEIVTPTPTLQDTPTMMVDPTATIDLAISGAEIGAQAYFDALNAQDFSSASKLVSAQSLLISSITAGDAYDSLVKQAGSGATWSNLTVIGAQVFQDRTALVSVSYTLGSIDPTNKATVETQVNETWAMHLEGGKWLFNWNNIIDTKSLDVDAKTNGGITVKPLSLIRYTDHISLEMLVQNVSGKDITFGNSTQTLATFYFGSTSQDAVSKKTYFTNNTTTLDYTIDVTGLFTTYPDQVDIIKYPAYPNYAPMFTFNLGG